jgi:DNA-directed RNA polymerase subunit omega
MEYLLERVDSKFTLVTLSAMRAREINDYYNQLGEGLGKIVPPQVTSVSRKPLSIAMEEIARGNVAGTCRSSGSSRARSYRRTTIPRPEVPPCSRAAPHAGR